MPGRVPGYALTAAAGAVLSAAGCSSGSPPAAATPRPAASFAAEARYGLTIAQCAIDRGLIPRADLDRGNGARLWLHNGRITPDAYFSDWWNENMAVITVAGKTLEEWRDGAFQRHRLPVRLCGTGATLLPVPAPAG